MSFSLFSLVTGGDGDHQFLLKIQAFDIKFVYVAVRNKKVTNFLLVAVHNDAHRWSIPDDYRRNTTIAKIFFHGDIIDCPQFATRGNIFIFTTLAKP